MARRRIAAKRKIIPDPVYSNEVVSKFVSSIMQSGKKAVAEKIVYGAIDEISKRLKQHPAAKKEQGEESGENGNGGDTVGSGKKNVSLSKAELSLEVFLKAIDNVAPVVEVRAKRVGGSTYQIPVEVRPERRQALSMRWIKEAAKSRLGQSMSVRLALELIDAAEGRGAACKKKEETHRMAKSNQAFAHIRAA